MFMCSSRVQGHFDTRFTHKNRQNIQHQNARAAVCGAILLYHLAHYTTVVNIWGFSYICIVCFHLALSIQDKSLYLCWSIIAPARPRGEALIFCTSLLYYFNYSCIAIDVCYTIIKYISVGLYNNTTKHVWILPSPAGAIFLAGS